MARRRLLINCDDLGYHPTFNEAIVEILCRGIVRSTSLMPAAPHFDDAIRRLAEAGIDRAGVHLTLTSEYRRLPIRPLCEPGQVPSLVEDRGVFPRDIVEHEKEIVLEEVENELRAQIERARRSGLRLTHLDGHMFFYEPDVGGPRLLEVAEELARAYRLPLRCRARTNSGTPEVMMLWKGFDSLEERCQAYLQILTSAATNLRELIIHPGKDFDAMREFSATGRRRFADYLFFKSPEFERAIADEDVGVIGWDEIPRCDAS